MVMMKACSCYIREANVVSKAQAREFIRQYLPVCYCVGLRCDLSQIAGVDSICSRRPLLQEFVPGLTYVALSRVKDPENPQVLNFRSKSLLPPSSRVLREGSADLGQLEENLKCFRNKDLSQEFFEIRERFFRQENDHVACWPDLE